VGTEKAQKKRRGTRSFNPCQNAGIVNEIKANLDTRIFTPIEFPGNQHGCGATVPTLVPKGYFKVKVTGSYISKGLGHFGLALFCACWNLCCDTVKNNGFVSILLLALTVPPYVVPLSFSAHRSEYAPATRVSQSANRWHLFSYSFFAREANQLEIHDRPSCLFLAGYKSSHDWTKLWKRILTNRRQHERFRINGRAFIYYEAPTPKIAEIIDISTDGVAFSYVGRAEPVNQNLSLEVILPDSTRFMEKLPCKTISDCQIDSATDQGLGTRRCSVQFENLADDQRGKIECFINDYCWRVSK